jgi:hypothetical protein
VKSAGGEIEGLWRVSSAKRTVSCGRRGSEADVDCDLDRSKLGLRRNAGTRATLKLLPEELDGRESTGGGERRLPCRWRCSSDVVKSISVVGLWIAGGPLGYKADRGMYEGSDWEDRLKRCL